MRTFMRDARSRNILRVFGFDFHFDTFLEICLIPRWICIDWEFVSFPQEFTEPKVRKCIHHILIVVSLLDICIASPCCGWSSRLSCEVVEYGLHTSPDILGSVTTNCNSFGIFNQSHQYILIICHMSTTFWNFLFHSCRIICFLVHGHPIVSSPEFDTGIIGLQKGFRAGKKNEQIWRRNGE